MFQLQINAVFSSPETISIIIAGSSLLVALLALIAQYNDWFEARRERKPRVSLFKFEDVKEPLDSHWTIQVRYENRPFESCSACYANNRLPNTDSGKLDYSKPLVIGGNLNFRVPRGLEIKEGAWIEVKGDGRTVRKKQFGAIQPIR